MTPPDDLNQLLGDTESFRVEKTASLTNTDKFSEAICSFANDIGNTGLPGYLFIGVDEKGVPTGAVISEALLTQLDQIRKNGQILPQPDARVSRHLIDGRAIAVVEVQPSSMPPVRYKNIVHIRTGPSRSVASAEQERRLTERRVDRARTWDMSGCLDADMSDL